MSKLEKLVQDFIIQYETDREKVSSLVKNLDELIKKQEDKVRKTAITLLPAMELISNKGYRFRGTDSKYFSGRGPVLKHDSKENKLYVFSVKDKCPHIVDLYNGESSRITYRKLLENANFETVMDSLLLVLNFNDQIVDEYASENTALENQLKKYDEI